MKYKVKIMFEIDEETMGDRALEEIKADMIQQLEEDETIKNAVVRIVRVNE